MAGLVPAIDVFATWTYNRETGSAWAGSSSIARVH